MSPAPIFGGCLMPKTISGRAEKTSHLNRAATDDPTSRLVDKTLSPRRTGWDPDDLARAVGLTPLSK